MSEEIERSLWNVLRPWGDALDTVTTVRPGLVSIEAAETGLSVVVHALEDGIDVRVGDLQFTVQGRSICVMQAHPPYPIERWTLHWEGQAA